MKIIAITETGGSYSNDVRKVLVEMSHTELAKLSGLDEYRGMERSQLKIGTNIDIQKCWDDMWNLRRCFNSIPSLSKQINEVANKLTEIQLPHIFESAND